MDKNCIVLFIEIEDYNMMLKLLIHSVLVIGTLVNGTFVIRTKFSPRYPDSPDNGELL